MSEPVTRTITNIVSENYKKEPIPKSNSTKIVRKWIKKQHHLALFWLCNISSTSLALLNIPMFIDTKSVANMVIMYIITVLACITFIVNSCKVAETFKQILQLYLLLDTIMLTVTASIVGFIGILIITQPGVWYVVLFGLIFCINMVLIGGNFKIILAYCCYKRWQVIVTKLTLGLSCLIFLIMASYFMINNFQDMSLTDDEQDSMQQLFFLYIFGLFTLYFQMFGRLSDLDGTANLQYHYQINEDEQIIQIVREDTSLHDEQEKIKQKQFKNNK